MSKRGPVVPQVAAETWKGLLAGAEDFCRLAPWRWMHDSHVVGLGDPKTGEALLVSVLGRLKQVFAVAIYRNDAGRRWLIETILGGEAEGEDGDAGFEMDAIRLEFTGKRELSKEDRAVLSAGGYAGTGKGRVWPQARSFTPGGYPWNVTQEEAEVLAWALPRVAAVARLLGEKPDLWKDHLEGEIAFVPAGFDPKGDRLKGEDIVWEPMIPPPEPPVRPVSLDGKRIAELLELRQAKGFQLEVDAGYSTVIAISDVDRPRFPKIAMAVDRKSGFVGGFHLSELGDRDGAEALGTVVYDSLMQLGARPEVILVQRRRVGAMLEKVAAELKVPVGWDAELGALNAARAHMEAHFGRR